MSVQGTERIVERRAEAAAPVPTVSTALVPVLHPDHFAHVGQEYRAKVARDLVAHLTPERRWDHAKSNLLNDYQRHLYALFLRLAGVPRKDIWTHLYRISVDVSEHQRPLYIEDVLFSSIVGFPSLDTREALGVAP